MSDESNTSSHLHAFTPQFEEASLRYVAAHGIERDEDRFVLKLQEELGELTQAWVEHTSHSRSCGRSAESSRERWPTRRPMYSGTACHH